MRYVGSLAANTDLTPSVVWQVPTGKMLRPLQWCHLLGSWNGSGLQSSRSMFIQSRDSFSHNGIVNNDRLRIELLLGEIFNIDWF